MELTLLSEQVTQHTIEKVIVARAQDNTMPRYWFAWTIMKSNHDTSILTVENGRPLAFATLDEVIETLCGTGFDGQIDVAWEKEQTTCN